MPPPPKKIPIDIQKIILVKHNYKVVHIKIGHIIDFFFQNSDVFDANVGPMSAHQHYRVANNSNHFPALVQRLITIWEYRQE